MYLHESWQAMNKFIILGFFIPLHPAVICNFLFTYYICVFERYTHTDYSIVVTTEIQACFFFVFRV